MAVTWNRRKRAANLARHHIDLAAAERFDFASALLEDDFSSEEGEQRFRAIGWLDGWLHLLVFTLDGDDVHAISLRRATKQEHHRYEAES